MICETCCKGIDQEESRCVIVKCLCHNELICDHCHIEWYNTCIDKYGITSWVYSYYKYEESK